MVTWCWWSSVRMQLSPPHGQGGGSWLYVIAGYNWQDPICAMVFKQRANKQKDALIYHNNWSESWVCMFENFEWEHTLPRRQVLMFNIHFQRSARSTQLRQQSNWKSSRGNCCLEGVGKPEFHGSPPTSPLISLFERTRVYEVVPTLLTSPNTVAGLLSERCYPSRPMP